MSIYWTPPLLLDTFFSLEFYFIYFLAVWGLCCCTGFSLVVEGLLLLSSYGARASHCCGFSCGAGALGHVGLRSFVAHGSGGQAQ